MLFSIEYLVILVLFSTDAVNDDEGSVFNHIIAGQTVANDDDDDE